METIFTDGKTTKSINTLLNVPEAWTWLSGGPKADEGMKLLHQEVPWLYRGLQIRMNSVASVPFTIYKGDSVFDTSENWENKLGWWANPRKSIMLAEGALTLFGKSYFFKNPSLVNNPLGLKYWFPLSIKEDIDPDEGFLGFKRKKQDGSSVDFNIEDILYIWGIDPYVEVGPPLSSPATAALAGAGVLWNVDEFAAAFFERGAIKATILSVPQGTRKDERNRLKRWWQTAVQGNNFATEVINADAVTAEVIGEGIKELENVELTKEKREDIATALGIPQSKMFSTSATDSNRAEDEQSMIEDMTVPECRLIEEAFNEQMFRDMGLRMKFQPEALNVFQEDEGERSAAFLNYVSATGKDKASIWAQFLGIEMPEGVKPEDLDSEPMEMMTSPQDLRDDTRNEKEEERKQFARWAKKRDPKEWRNFKFNHLDDLEQIELLGAQVPQEDEDNKELVKALTGVIDELRMDRVKPE